MSEPPRPSVVTSLAVETPWKPATSTIRSSSSAARMRSARTSRMRAFVCEVSVTIPAWEPVSEIARCPRSLIAIAHSAHDMRSPVESSMSISRGSGVVDTSSAIEISSSVVLPRADSTATTRWPVLAGGDDAAGGALEALRIGDGGAAELHHDGAGHALESRRAAVCHPFNRAGRKAD